MGHLAAVLLIVALASGCIGQPSGGPRTVQETAKASCMELCEQAVSEGADLSSGPCLSENVADGWVCDIAHSPRTAVDNDPANQCSAYGKGAPHFVEVDAACNLIREE